jgi:hypothetical protein
MNESYSDAYEKGNEMAVKQLAATYLIEDPDLYAFINSAVGSSWDVMTSQISAVELVAGSDGTGVALKVTLEAH